MNIDPDQEPVVDKTHHIQESTFDPSSKHLERMDDNELATSLMQDGEFPKLRGIPLDTNKYQITEVIDDVILGVFEDDISKSSDGFTQTEGGLFINSDENLKENRVLRVLQVGGAVKEVKPNELIVVAHDVTLGTRTIDFDGQSACLVREANVFFKVVKK